MPLDPSKAPQGPRDQPKLESALASVKPGGLEPATGPPPGHPLRTHGSRILHADGQAAPVHIIGTGHAGPKTSPRAIHGHNRRPVRDCRGHVLGRRLRGGQARHRQGPGADRPRLSPLRLVRAVADAAGGKSRPGQSRRRGLAARAGHSGAGGAAAGDHELYRLHAGPARPRRRHPSGERRPGRHPAGLSRAGRAADAGPNSGRCRHRARPDRVCGRGHHHAWRWRAFGRRPVCGRRADVGGVHDLPAQMAKSAASRPRALSAPCRC